MTAGVAVRPTTVDDWALLRTVRLRALRESPMAFASTYEREAAIDEQEWRERAGSGRCFIAYIGTDVVGMAVGYDDPDAPRHVRELVGMWVAAQTRRQGAGAALVAAVAAQARSDGKHVLGLWVVDGNDEARRLYERLGFVATGESMPRHTTRRRPNTG